MSCKRANLHEDGSSNLIKNLHFLSQLNHIKPMHISDPQRELCPPVPKAQQPFPSLLTLFGVSCSPHTALASGS